MRRWIVVIARRDSTFQWYRKAFFVLAIAGSLLGLCACLGVRSSPISPPRTIYTIDAVLDISGPSPVLSVTEEIAVANTTPYAIERIAAFHRLGSGRPFELTADGKPLLLLNPTDRATEGPFVFQLEEALNPGETVILETSFETRLPRSWVAALESRSCACLAGWYVQLDWGRPTHDEYRVRIEAPPEYAVVTSGQLDKRTGRYHIEAAKSFGIVFGVGCEILEASTRGTLIQVMVPPAYYEAGRFLLDSAVDAIKFYQDWVGFYPHRSLAIIPGAPPPTRGGYPVATAIVAIHALSTYDPAEPDFWSWIVAHEIGHEYWGEHVMEKDKPGWLWIAAGIYMDQQYTRSRNLDPSATMISFEPYVDALRAGYDTTIEIPPEQVGSLPYSYNQVIQHSKGYGVLTALSTVIGKEAFERVLLRTLHEYGGRWFGADALRAECERESGQDLGWFFEQWLRTNRYLSYEIIEESCAPGAHGYVSEITVVRRGTLAMPVPVQAVFEDGSAQTKLTDRLLDIQVVRFESASPLSAVVIDPLGELPMVVPPLAPSASEVSSRIGSLPYVGAGRWAVEVYQDALQVGLEEAHDWWILGLKLFAEEYDLEALESFKKSDGLVEPHSFLGFASMAWQGIVLDVLGRREEAVACYTEALTRDAGYHIYHDQFGIVLDAASIELWLETPFERTW